MSKINLELDNDTALVLFDWISSQLENTSSELEIDKATEQALANLECGLEKRLSDVLQSNYRELVVEAKKRMTPRMEAD